MLKRKAEMTHESKKVWGGKGELDLCKILTPEELGGRAKLFNIVTVAPGQSIGLHSHTDDSEVYFLLEGELEEIRTRYGKSISDLYREYFSGVSQPVFPQNPPVNPTV